mgnify:CR=1 FL=1
MKKLLVSLLLVTQFSCIGKAQENTIAIQIPTTDSLKTDTLSLLFVGDLMQHQGQINAARTTEGGYDYSSYFEYVKEEISRADFAIANLEVTLGGKPYKGYPAFSAPDEYLTAIHNATGTVISPYYDSLLVKVTSWDNTFEGVCRRALRAISEVHIRGVKTNIPFY